MAKLIDRINPFPTIGKTFRSYPIELWVFGSLGALLTLSALLGRTNYWFNVLIVFFALVVTMLSLISMVKFLLAVAHKLNSTQQKGLGLLVFRGVVNWLAGIWVLQLAGSIAQAMMPHQHYGVICDLLDMLRFVYRVTEYHQTLDRLFWGSFIWLAVLTLGLILSNNFRSQK